MDSNVLTFRSFLLYWLAYSTLIISILELFLSSSTNFMCIYHSWHCSCFIRHVLLSASFWLRTHRRIHSKPHTDFHHCNIVHWQDLRNVWDIIMSIFSLKESDSELWLCHRMNFCFHLSTSISRASAHHKSSHCLLSTTKAMKEMKI